MVDNPLCSGWWSLHHALHGAHTLFSIDEADVFASGGIVEETDGDDKFYHCGTPSSARPETSSQLKIRAHFLPSFFIVESGDLQKG